MTVVQLLTDLKEKTDVYFGLGSIGILFLCAFLFWCVYKEKSRMMKVYVWYLGIACIFMLNPLSLYVIDKTGNMDVYERFFWLLLSPVMVALTASVFMQHSKKLILPCLILLLLCGNSVFTTTEYKKAENMEKIRPALVALEVGDEITFHISRLKSVRTQASELGAIYNRQFKTRTDREKQTITVMRTL